MIIFKEVQRRRADRQFLPLPKLCLSERRKGPMVTIVRSGNRIRSRLPSGCSRQHEGVSRVVGSMRYGVAKTFRQRPALCFGVPASSSFSRPPPRRSLSGRRSAKYRRLKRANKAMALLERQGCDQKKLVCVLALLAIEPSILPIESRSSVST